MCRPQVMLSSVSFCQRAGINGFTCVITCICVLHVPKRLSDWYFQTRHEVLTRSLQSQSCRKQTPQPKRERERMGRRSTNHHPMFRLVVAVVCCVFFPSLGKLAYILGKQNYSFSVSVAVYVHAHTHTHTHTHTPVLRFTVQLNSVS